MRVTGTTCSSIGDDNWETFFYKQFVKSVMLLLLYCLAHNS